MYINSELLVSALGGDAWRVAAIRADDDPGDHRRKRVQL
jgi:hypothetical protein